MTDNLEYLYLGDTSVRWLVVPQSRFSSKTVTVQISTQFMHPLPARNRLFHKVIEIELRFNTFSALDAKVSKVKSEKVTVKVSHSCWY